MTIFFATTAFKADDEEDQKKEAQIAASKVCEDVASSDHDVDQHQGERPKLNCQRRDVLDGDLSAQNEDAEAIKF